jgi:uncharacterized Zn finger protein
VLVPARRIEVAGNWWARRWMAALDGFGWTGRLARGRAYARNGRVLDIEILPGVVRARVEGSASSPYRVEMAVERFPDAVWDRVIGSLARQAIYVAKMLAGDLPAEVVQLCEVAEASLFPDHPDEIAMRCSCPEWAVPCKHVAAVHYALAAELDRDPFLLFRLRGKTREDLTSALRERRSSLNGGPGALHGPAGGDRSGSVEEESHELGELPVDRFWDLGAELDELRFEIRPPDVPDAVLRLLGPPPAWSGHDEALTQLQAAYRVASASVRDAALADVDADDADADDSTVDGELADGDLAARAAADHVMAEPVVADRQTADHLAADDAER